MREYVEEKCKDLTEDQRKQLAVVMDDIVFLLPEDVSVVFNEHGEFEFCAMTLFCCQVSLLFVRNTQNMPAMPSSNYSPIIQIIHRAIRTQDSQRTLLIMRYDLSKIVGAFLKRL